MDKKRICSICGQEILDKHLSKDPVKRNYELKWRIHYNCKEKMFNMEALKNDPTNPR